MPRTGMTVERGTRDELNSMSRVEKRLEKAKVENGGEEEKGAGGREEGCIGVAALWAGPDSERRTSAKVRPFRRGRKVLRGWLEKRGPQIFH